MEYLGFSAAQLADQIGVQRSSFSHILNGRNKPSADFINKLLIAYPDLNANWLFGLSENMLTSQRSKTGIRDLFSDIDTIKETQQNSPIVEFQYESKKVIPTPAEKVKPQPIIQSDKQIEKIILLYSDKSFLEFNPES